MFVCVGGGGLATICCSPWPQMLWAGLWRRRRMQAALHAAPLQALNSDKASGDAKKFKQEEGRHPDMELWQLLGW